MDLAELQCKDDQGENGRLAKMPHDGKKEERRYVTTLIMHRNMSKVEIRLALASGTCGPWKTV